MSPDSTPTISDLVAAAIASDVPRPIVATWLDGLEEGPVRIDEACEDQNAVHARALVDALRFNLAHV